MAGPKPGALGVVGSSPISQSRPSGASASPEEWPPLSLSPDSWWPLSRLEGTTRGVLGESCGHCLPPQWLWGRFPGPDTISYPSRRVSKFAASSCSADWPGLLLCLALASLLALTSTSQPHLCCGHSRTSMSQVPVPWSQDPPSPQLLSMPCLLPFALCPLPFAPCWPQARQAEKSVAMAGAERQLVAGDPGEGEDAGGAQGAAGPYLEC